MQKTLPKRGTWFRMHLQFFQLLFLCSTPLIVNAQSCLYDTQAPTITCPQNLTANANVGFCGAQLILTAPISGDNCSVVSITNDYTGTANASGFYPVGTTTVTWTVRDNGLGTLPNIALLSATGGVPNAEQDIVAKLTETGAFNSISTINVAVVTPSLATLQQYDAVFVWNDDPFQNEIALGNVLAAYVDAGGGVVVGMFTQDSPSDFDLQGAFRNNGYLPLDGISSPFAATGPHTMSIINSAHPIMNGVASFNGGSSSFRGSNLSLQTGASLVANWSTGEPLIAYKEPTNGRTVSLNFYPPSSDSRGDFWNSSTDGDLIMANALLWAAGHENTGNTATCTVNITVNDTEAPTITCPQNLTANADIGSCGAQLNLAVPVSGDNCSVVSITNDYNGTGDASDFYPVGTTTVTWTATDDGLGALPNIALLSATGGVPNAEQDIVAKLTATGAFNAISTIDVAVATPSLATLEQYDAVLVWNDDPFQNDIALGDVLAAYVDVGGGVVVGMFTQDSPSINDLQGAFRNNGYLPLDGTASPFAAAGPHTMSIINGAHPIMTGVASFNGGSSSFRGSNLSLQTGASLVANWSTGEPLIAYKEPTNGRTVSLNFYPPSSDSRGDLWNSSTDGDLIMANALVWAAGDASGNETTCSQTVTVLDNPTVSISSPQDAIDGVLDDVVTIYFGSNSLLNTLGVTNSANLNSTVVKDCPEQVSYQWQYQNLGNGIVPIAGAWVNTLGTSANIVVTASGVNDFHYAYRVIITNTANEAATSNYIRVYSINTRCQNANKVKVCMLPNGNPANAHEICININAVAALLENSPGSSLGPCNTLFNSKTSFAADFEIFPNPARSTFNIEYMPDVSSDVRIELYNIRGQLMKEVFNGPIAAKSAYQSAVDISDFSGGIYLVRLTDGQGVRTLRLVLSK